MKETLVSLAPRMREAEKRSAEVARSLCDDAPYMVDLTKVEALRAIGRVLIALDKKAKDIMGEHNSLVGEIFAAGPPIQWADPNSPAARFVFGLDHAAPERKSD